MGRYIPRPKYSCNVPYGHVGYKSMKDLDSRWIYAANHLSERIYQIWMSISVMYAAKDALEEGSPLLKISGLDEQEYDNMIGNAMNEIARLRHVLVEQVTPVGITNWPAERTEDNPFPYGV